MINLENIQSIPALKKELDKGYIFTTAYEYKNVKGINLYWRVRLEHPTDNKIIRPIHETVYGAFKLGEPDWIKKQSKPLYGLQLLSQHPAAQVWLTEGEKCANALNADFARWGVQSEHIALTSGSATSTDKADWQPLKGAKNHSMARQ